MQTKSKNGLDPKIDLSQYQKNLSRALAFTLTTHDLALANILEIIGNSQLVAGGPTGVIVFIANATVGPDNLIKFNLPPDRAIANAKPEIANAEKVEVPDV